MSVLYQGKEERQYIDNMLSTKDYQLSGVLLNMVIHMLEKEQSSDVNNPIALHAKRIDFDINHLVKLFPLWIGPENHFCYRSICLEDTEHVAFYHSSDDTVTRDHPQLTGYSIFTEDVDAHLFWAYIDNILPNLKSIEIHTELHHNFVIAPKSIPKHMALESLEIFAHDVYVSTNVLSSQPSKESYTKLIYDRMTEGLKQLKLCLYEMNDALFFENQQRIYPKLESLSLVVWAGAYINLPVNQHQMPNLKRLCITGFYGNTTPSIEDIATHVDTICIHSPR